MALFKWRTERLRGPSAGSLGGVLLVALCGSIASAQTVDGVVREEASSVAISGADITLMNQADGTVVRATSDETGRFSLRFPEAGLYRLGATRIGYESFSSDAFFISDGQNVTADLLLKVRPIELEPLDVVTEGQVAQLSRAGFYRRMERGFGHFLVREDIEALHEDKVTNLFRRMPGVRVVSDGSLGAQDVIMRGGRSMFFRIGQTGEVCYPSISIDGMLVRAGGLQPTNRKSPGESFRGRQVGTWGQLLHPNDVEAVEVYAGAGGLPVQVAGSISPCGAILIYTRD